MEQRYFGRTTEVLAIPDLVEIQTRKYAEFLQLSADPARRKNHGLEAVLREVFPIASYDESMRLDYLSYRLGRPRYTPDQCRALRLTYGMPFRVIVRLSGQAYPEPIEEEVYVGEIPIMIGGGEFIINGAERVIVSQLHRSPGVDFAMELEAGDRRLHSCRIIPERGSWIETNVTKRDTLQMRIDQSSKIPVTAFLRAMDPKCADTETIIRIFYETKRLVLSQVKRGTPVQDFYVSAPVVDKDTGEVVLEAGQRIGEKWEQIRNSRIGLGIGADVTAHANRKEGVVKALLKLAKQLRKKTLAQMEMAHSGMSPAERKQAKKVIYDNPLAFVIAVFSMRRVDAKASFLAPLKLQKGIGKLDVGEISNLSIEEVCKFLPGQAQRDISKAIIGFCKCVVEKYEGNVESFWKGRTAEQVIAELAEIPEVGEFKIAPLLVNMLHRHPDLPYARKFPDPESISISADVQVLKSMAELGLLDTDLAEAVRAGKQITDAQKRRALDIAKGLCPEYPGELDLPLWEMGRTGSWHKYAPQAREQSKGRPGGNIEVVADPNCDPLILNTLQDDKTKTHDEAVLYIYGRLRVGNPANLQKAKQLFTEKFYDANRYRLGRVGRFRLNRKFGTSVAESEMTLRPEDFIECLRYVMKLRAGEGYTDDIDDLGNRRLRTIDELAGDEVRKGFLKLRRTVQERMSLKDPKELTPRTLINSKSVSSSIEFFFGRSELSQVVDQTNPLAQLANERRLSALGPGGLNRKRAGFEVRDVHVSHYGRICPVETPEGTNIGLIAQLGIYATVDPYGFLVSPYRKVEKGKVNGEVRTMRADEEIEHVVAPADVPTDPDGKILSDVVVARVGGDFKQVPVADVQYMDISPKQLVGVSASLIPFLEHDDANRALMGSNMQRQAVPLLEPEPAIVATGMEKPVAENSGMVVRAQEAGEVMYVDAQRIVVRNRDGWETEYVLRKFVGLNERTCLNQKPIVRVGQKVKTGQVLADGAGTKDGELALGRNVLVAFLTWDGFNFEDAILVSEDLLKDDRFTSIHIDEFEVEVRETKLGREEFTRDIPNVSERQLRNLDEEGMIRVGTRVQPGDILVGKVSPKSKTELSPEEKLLHAIFGRAGEDVKNDSLTVPGGVEGIVIEASKFSRVAHLSEAERRKRSREARRVTKEMDERIIAAFRSLVEMLNTTLRTKMADPQTGVAYGERDEVEVMAQIERFDYEKIQTRSQSFDEGREIVRREWPKVQDMLDEKEREVARLKRGDELPTGVLEMVKVWIATKRPLSVGDKMAGRHGNKGVIARILPAEDMPFLPDGRPVEILLNPLGVPSRMNVGQILETHLGWAAKVLGFQAISPVFDGCKEDTIHQLLEEAGLPRDGKIALHDGRTGEPFDQEVAVGYIYMMKLHHLVDDKVHARSTGPYSLITQQPLGGKARNGGQRFGEMEVWALEGYGAAYVLQELLTVKSDDVEGRTKIYESMVMGRNTLEAGTPVSFDVLT
ncbi:MAG: DNA-directed RNA polymerase subunit beta, partial [Phycisphaerae bacterium]